MSSLLKTLKKNAAIGGGARASHSAVKPCEPLTRAHFFGTALKKTTKKKNIGVDIKMRCVKIAALVHKKFAVDAQKKII